MPKQTKAKKTSVKASKTTAVKKQIVPKSRTKIAAAKVATRTPSRTDDGPYLLKLTMFALLGLLWIKIGFQANGMQLPLPIGFILGLYLARKERFQLDRKIEYAVLLAALLVGFIAPFGLYITI